MPADVQEAYDEIISETLAEGRAEGRAEGEAKGTILTYYDLYKNNQISMEVITNNLKITKAEFLNKVQKLI